MSLLPNRFPQEKSRKLKIRWSNCLSLFCLWLSSTKVFAMVIKNFILIELPYSFNQFQLITVFKLLKISDILDHKTIKNIGRNCSIFPASQQAGSIKTIIFHDWPEALKDIFKFQIWTGITQLPLSLKIFFLIVSLRCFFQRENNVLVDPTLKLFNWP